MDKQMFTFVRGVILIESVRTQLDIMSLTRLELVIKLESIFEFNEKLN